LLPTKSQLKDVVIKTSKCIAVDSLPKGSTCWLSKPYWLAHMGKKNWQIWLEERLSWNFFQSLLANSGLPQVTVTHKVSIT